MRILEPLSPRAEQWVSEYDLGHVRAEYKQKLFMPTLENAVKGDKPG